MTSLSTRHTREDTHLPIHCTKEDTHLPILMQAPAVSIRALVLDLSNLGEAHRATRDLWRSLLIVEISGEICGEILPSLLIVEICFHSFNIRMWMFFLVRPFRLLVDANHYMSRRKAGDTCKII